MKIWGYAATLGWALLAFIAGQFVALGVLIWFHFSDLNTLIARPFDGAMVTLFILIANPITMAVIALAIWLKGAAQADYLALRLPPARDVWLSLLCLVVLIVAGDAALYFSGYPLITPFQLESYTTAGREGWLPALLFGAIVMAPAGEEVVFRGFLFRGWARSKRTTWPAIVVISVLWAALHVQYDWTGLVQIFVIGLFLGWMRWRSGSLLLTLLLHALFNLEGTLETVVQIYFRS